MKVQVHLGAWFVHEIFELSYPRILHVKRARKSRAPVATLVADRKSSMLNNLTSVAWIVGGLIVFLLIVLLPYLARQTERREREAVLSAARLAERQKAEASSLEEARREVRRLERGYCLLEERRAVPGSHGYWGACVRPNTHMPKACDYAHLSDQELSEMRAQSRAQLDAARQAEVEIIRQANVLELETPSSFEPSELKRVGFVLSEDESEILVDLAVIYGLPAGVRQAVSCRRTIPSASTMAILEERLEAINQIL